MVTVTILGAGITGLSIASQLPKEYEVTIVGKQLPGDELSQEWASPWAGACFVPVQQSNAREQAFQLDSFAGLWKLTKQYPDSGLRRVTMTEIMEFGSPNDIWYSTKLPNFRFLERSELNEEATFGMEYETVAISPPVFLAWMRKRLEAAGVKFQRLEVKSLADLKIFPHDILINAAGANSVKLGDVKDDSLVPYRLQSIVIKSSYLGAYIYRGRNDYYFNMFGRGDGTAYIGGIKKLGLHDYGIYDSDRKTILSRGHKLIPSILPSLNPEDYLIAYDIGMTYSFRPVDKGGVRAEAELIDGQNVIHAYGQEAGGYCYSFGLARKIAQIASGQFHELPLPSKM